MHTSKQKRVCTHVHIYTHKGQWLTTWHFELCRMHFIVHLRRLFVPKLLAHESRFEHTQESITKCFHGVSVLLWSWVILLNVTSSVFSHILRTCLPYYIRVVLHFSLHIQLWHTLLDTDFTRRVSSLVLLLLGASRVLHLCKQLHDSHKPTTLDFFLNKYGSTHMV